MTDLATRARRARLTIARSHVPEWLTTGLCIASILLGLVLVVEPDVVHSASFRRNMDAARPQVWGLSLIVPSAITLLALAARRRDVWWPLATLAGWYAAWTVGSVLSQTEPRAVGTAAVIYGLAVWFAAILSWLYYAESQGRS